ncbi:MAG: hypothetical protein EA359_04130 [Balneolaceae bacterium]|nr:MAG: hypothetical protein EA359_04130 [Balneolaceae bacterium]
MHSLPFIIVLFLVISIIISGCDIFGSDEKKKKEKEDDFSYTLYTNMNDALLFSATSVAGDSVAFFGERNNLGIPTKVAGAVVQLQNKYINSGDEKIFIDNSTFEILFGGFNNLPTRISSDEYTFIFDWESSSTFVLTAIDNEGTGRTQIAINMDELENEMAMLKSSGFDISGLNNQSRSSLFFPGYLCGDSNEDGTIAYLSGTSSNVIHIERCGANLDGALVRLKIAQKGVIDQWFMTTPINNGRYRANIPIGGDTMGEKFLEGCESVLGVIGSSCEVSKQLLLSSPLYCSKISLYAGPAAPKVFAACQVAVAAYATTCAIVGWSPLGDTELPEGIEWPSWATPQAYICPGLSYLVDRGVDYFGEPIHYTVTISHPSITFGHGSSHHSNVATSPANGPYPDITIKIDGDPDVIGFWADPGNPPAGVGYTVYASMSCVEPGSTIRLSIVGTDGYSNSRSCVVTAANIHNQTCMLQVPGASGGVRDVITLTVNGITIDNLTVIFGGGAKQLLTDGNITRIR